MNTTDIKRLVFMTILSLFIIIAGMKTFYTVTPGFEVIHLRLGKLLNINKDPGIYFSIPFVDTVVFIDCRIQKLVSKTEAFSHDLQTVDLEVAINYRVDDPWLVYKDIGLDYAQTVIDPFTQESVKAVIAKFSAEELTQNRNEAKLMVKDDLRKSLEQVYIKLVDFNFIHADFHNDFIKAVEAKQIAEQRAKQAKFETENAKELARQVQLSADAEAYSLKVKKEEVTPKLALLKAIEKWDGKLPRIMTSTALMNIPLEESEK